MQSRAVVSMSCLEHGSVPAQGIPCRSQALLCVRWNSICRNSKACLNLLLEKWASKGVWMFKREISKSFLFSIKMVVSKFHFLVKIPVCVSEPKCSAHPSQFLNAVKSTLISVETWLFLVFFKDKTSVGTGGKKSLCWDFSVVSVISSSA